jgi:hypothetical protein
MEDEIQGGDMEARYFSRNENKIKWLGLHSEELYDINYSQNIIREMQARIMRWAGHVERIGSRRGLYRILVMTPEGRNETIWKT